MSSVVTPADLRVDSLGHRFDGRSVLAGVDLHRRGGVVTVLGRNGAGKSTLLRCVATVLTPGRGTVTVDDLDAGRENERIEIRRRLGYLPQRTTFSHRAKVFDVLDCFAVAKEMLDDRVRRRQVMTALDLVGLRDRVAERADTLSDGMQRRLGLAHALIGTPTLLVLDEPTAGLDPDERRRFESILAERRRTATIVVSTHLTEEAATSDHVVVVHGGGCAFSGPPSDLAAVARGWTWTENGLPPPRTIAAKRRPDGRYHCLGTPPPGADVREPTVEDGYYLLTM